MAPVWVQMHTDGKRPPCPPITAKREHLGFLQQLTELGKSGRSLRSGGVVPLRTDHQHLARPCGCVLHLIGPGDEVHRDHLRFFAADLVERPSPWSQQSAERNGESIPRSAETRVQRGEF